MSKSYLDQLFNLEKKVVLITGANGQLGTALCKAYKKAGAIVAAVDVSTDDMHSFADGCFQLDICDKKSIRTVFGKIAQQYHKIDILINNAGVSTFEPFEERPEERFDWVMDVNLKGTFFCLQEYVNLYDKNKWDNGNIVNIGSIFGVVSPDYRNYTDCDRKNSEVYGATKAGIIQMSKYFAVHLAERGVRVNVVSPGGIYNPDNPQGKDFINNYSFRCPMKRMAKVEEMAGAVIYLSSDAAKYTTGQNIVVDGGLTCW
jgi:gluconate 5-dehydrogenase